MERKMIVRRESGINDIPDAVLDDIISRLALPEAVRAALVAKTWRNGWKLSKELNFNDTFYCEFIRGTDHRLDSVVNSILLRHMGMVRKFKIHIRHPIPDGVSIDVSEGLVRLSEKRVEYLKIFVNQLAYLELPSQIYNMSCLSSLYLQHCQLGDANDFGGFPNLHSIRLSDVLLPDSMLGLIVSQSPRLSHTYFEFLTDGSPVDLRQAALENLDTIIYHCKQCTRPLKLTHLPSLTCASFKTWLPLPEHPSKVSRVEYFSSLIPLVTELTLDGPAVSSLIDEITLPMQQMSPLKYLDDLTLAFIDIGVDKMLAVTFGLIRNAPNLSCLHIHVDQDDVDHHASMSFLNEQLRLPHLRRMEYLFFEDLISTPVELKLIETLIQLSPHLKMIYLKCCISTEREQEVELYNNLQRIQHPERVRFKFVWLRRRLVG